ncbi:MAG: glycosyltransferase [Magnetococcales bacterium]|nr:glycosyltransferase [Magnetococcales bacterium]
MKILVVGDGRSAIHEVAVVEAFGELGHQVESFYWQPYFASRSKLEYLWLRFQDKFIIGPTINRINSDLIKAAIKFNPHIIFIYRGTHIKETTIFEIKRNIIKVFVTGYNNDDPFADGHPPWLWRHFRKCVPIYDLVLAYRHHNLDEFKCIGAKRVELLRSWYIPKFNYPASLSDKDRILYDCDVVFIGHYENDGRLELLEEISRSGFSLRIFGPPYEWNRLLAKSKYLKHLSPVHLVWGDDYNKAVCGAKIALCFLSKLNRDTYTRRCFEIPAAGTLLLSEYSDDLASLYRAGEEADYFASKEELIKKISLYINDDILRSHVAANGSLRVRNDGHDIGSRMAKVLDYVEQSYEIKEPL